MVDCCIHELIPVCMAPIIVRSSCVHVLLLALPVLSVECPPFTVVVVVVVALQSSFCLGCCFFFLLHLLFVGWTIESVTCLPIYRVCALALCIRSFVFVFYS